MDLKNAKPIGPKYSIFYAENLSVLYRKIYHFIIYEIKELSSCYKL